MRRVALLIAIVLAGWPCAALSQQSVEDFYRGKKLDMIIGYSSGGTYDLYARLVARYLGNYIPGKPLIVPRNMPGAGSRAATKWVYSVGPKDGTVLATADHERTSSTRAWARARSISRSLMTRTRPRAHWTNRKGSGAKNPVG